MGYVEETGAAQYLRDARILPIYEGTNGIQANDLAGRKLGRDGGEAARELLAESPSRTMTDLVHTLQDQELREALAHYTLSGPLGRLLDAQTEDLGQQRLQVFEMSHLMALGQKHLVPILLYLFHRVEQRLEEGTPSLLIVEEAAHSGHALTTNEVGPFQDAVQRRVRRPCAVHCLLAAPGRPKVEVRIHFLHPSWPTPPSAGQRSVSARAKCRIGNAC